MNFRLSRPLNLQKHLAKYRVPHSYSVMCGAKYSQVQARTI